MSERYIIARDAKNRDYLTSIRGSLPAYLNGFFLSQMASTELSTQVEQGRDIQNFLAFIKETDPDCAEIPISKIPEEKIISMTATDIDTYVSWMMYPVRDGVKCKGVSPNTVNRRLATLSNLYKHFMRNGLVKGNPVELVSRSKKRKKPISYFTPEDIETLFKGIISMDKMFIVIESQEKNKEDKKKKERKAIKSTSEYKKNHLPYVLRDICMCSVMLGTGIRVSELVSLDCDNINITNGTIRYTRKGGDEGISFLPDDAIEYLEMYLGNVPTRLTDKYGTRIYAYLDFARDHREDADFISSCKKTFPQESKRQDFLSDMLELLFFYTHPGRLALLGEKRWGEAAVFISKCRTRISTRAVETIIKDYTMLYLPNKQPGSPHTLRKSFATELLRKNGGRIFMVQTALGHKSSQTTTGFYTAVNLEDVMKEVSKYPLFKVKPEK